MTTDKPKAHEAQDIRQHQVIASVDYCDEQRAAVCAVRSIGGAQDLYASALWLLPLDGPPSRLTLSQGMNTSPCWSPDGSRIAFLSDRSGSPQIHLLSMEGGEATPLGHFERGVQSLRWSPDGQRLLVLSQVAVDPDRHDEVDDGGDGENKDEDDRSAAAADGPEVAWRLPYKADGIGYLLRHRVHLFVVDVESGESRRVTRGGFNVAGGDWSPDGRRIAFSRTREGRFAHRTDIWTIAADGSDARQLTQDQATAISPAWSADGRSIAFLGAIDDGDPLARPWHIALDSGAISSLGAEELEAAAGAELLWNAAGSAIRLVIAERGLQKIAEIAVPSGDVTRLVEGDRQLSQLSGGRDVLVHAAESVERQIEVFACDLDGRNERALTAFNAWRDERMPLRGQYRRFEVPDGNGGTEKIDGWVVRAAYATGQPGPLLVDVHGGPASYVLLDAAMHPYWPMLCSRGWTILALNAAGSGSYGKDFADRLHSRWGELDLPQHLAAVKALQDEGIADERVAIAGKSYGGYLSAWGISQTHVFRAAVISAPVTNIETHYGTSDGGYYADPYSMKAEPYLDRELSQRLSPMKHADKAKTPALILQGKDDERCPKCQAEELYVTLMCSGDTPVEMVLYPNEGHHFLESGKPSYRIDAAQRLVRWLERWVGEPHGGSRSGARGDGGRR